MKSENDNFASSYQTRAFWRLLSIGLLKNRIAIQSAKISPNKVITRNISTPAIMEVAGRILDNIMVRSASRTPKPPGAPGVINPPIHAKTCAQMIIGRLSIFKSVLSIKKKMQKRITPLINKNSE